MKDTVTLDAAGRVLIPKSLRDSLQLSAGDTLELTHEGEQMTLRPVHASAALQKEQGVWVFSRGGATISNESTNRLLMGIRSGRAPVDTDGGG